MRNEKDVLDLSLLHRRILNLLSGAVLVLTALNLLHQFLWHFWQQDFWYLMWRFDVAGDQTIPTWFSSLLLLICALLLGVCAAVAQKRHTGYVRYWQALALIFVAFSIDETATIHEWSGSLLADLSLSGVFYYRWIVFGLIFVGGFGLIYLRFFWHLPVESRRRFLLAAVLYVGGALGVEMLNARYEDLINAETLAYQLMTAVEELLEMGGILVFIDALLRYVETRVPVIRLHLTPAAASVSHEAADAQQQVPPSESIIASKR